MYTTFVDSIFSTAFFPFLLSSIRTTTPSIIRTTTPTTFYKKNCILFNFYSYFYYQKITVHAGYSLLDKMGS